MHEGSRTFTGDLRSTRPGLQLFLFARMGVDSAPLPNSTLISEFGTGIAQGTANEMNTGGEDVLTKKLLTPSMRGVQSAAIWS